MKNYQKLDSWVTDMAMTEASFNRLQDVIESAGELPSRVEFSSLVDNTFVKAEYENLKK